MTELLRIALPDEASTVAAGARLAAILRPGDIVFLIGPLGAGKTTLARGVLSVLAPDAGETPSPTYAIVQPYQTRLGALWHVDLYRIERSSDIGELGLDEAMGDAVVLIEWPDRLGEPPPDRLEVVLDLADDDGRTLDFRGFGVWEDRVHEF